jgi:hypothetical protein
MRYLKAGNLFPLLFYFYAASPNTNAQIKLWINKVRKYIPEFNVWVKLKWIG